MKITTLEHIHSLLAASAAAANLELQAARQKVSALEEAAEIHWSSTKNIPPEIESAREAREEAGRKAKAARDALDDFEAQDW